MPRSRKTMDKTEERIACLIQASTVAEAAELCKVNEATIYRWLQEPQFAKAYEEARHQVLNTAIDRVQCITDKATQTLERNLSCGSPAVEVRAALGVLELALKVREFIILHHEVKELEEAVEQLERAREPSHPSRR